MKRAFTIYYDDSEWNPEDEAMIYKYETGKYFDGESAPVRASILRDCSEHFLKAYNDGDPLSLEQLGGEYGEGDRIMKRLPVPARFQEFAAHLGVGVRHFINHYAVGDNYLSLHEAGRIELTKEEREYLINLMMGRMARSLKQQT